MYIHYYYNFERAVEEEMSFDRRLLQWREELLSNRRVTKHEQSYKKYFNVHTTTDGETQVENNQQAIKDKKRYMGFFALMSNIKLESSEILKLYRSKDLIEKTFGNYKERLNARRALVSSEHSLSGKLFVQFIALILVSYIKNKWTIKAYLRNIHCRKY